MPLTPRERLGPYEIVSPLGEGGMGEVYKARDTRLDRSVVKILPDALSSDPEFRERFDREARVISRLEHPNICALYDVGQQEIPGRPAPVSYLVMQYLDGETLAARLSAGPLPLDQSLAIAVQIADALDRAHRDGIVHRDLKPGNIMLTKSGAGSTGAPQARLLDFGLAKSGGMVATGTARVVPQGSILPTTPPNLTAQGMILGTFQYMAPEQIEGADADARTDIFAFGAVLYEMLTGKRAFAGKTQASLIASIMGSEPAPIAELMPLAPPQLDRVLKRCLAKDPDDRWQSVRDLKAALEWIANGLGAAVAAPSASAAVKPRLAQRLATAGIGLAAGAVIAAAASWAILGRRAEPAVMPIHFQIQPPTGTRWNGDDLAISPAGDAIVFAAEDDTASRAVALWLYRFDSASMRKLDGTTAARSPFWSPDGRWIGFTANRKLLKLDVAKGTIDTVCDAPCGAADMPGSSWSPNGTMLFAGSSENGLRRVAASGGTPTAVTTLDRTHGESVHNWPTFLPDGTHFLFQLFGRDNAGLYLGSLGDAEKTRLVSQDILDMTKVVYTPGYLLYARKGTLFAHPFDAAARKLTGEPIRLADGFGSGGPGTGIFDASQNGVLAYRPLTDTATMQPTWVDRKGQKIAVVGPPGDYGTLNLSPDGKTLALDRFTSMGIAVWLVDVERGTVSRFSGEPYGANPIWSPDGGSIVYASARDTPPNLFQQRLNGSEERLVHMALQTVPNSWAPNGEVVFTAVNSATRGDISAVDTAKRGEPRAILNTRFNERNAQVSPDGRWMAFTADDTGTSEIYLTSFPNPGRRIRVSTNGGLVARWRADGRELVYISPVGPSTPRKLMSVAIATAASDPQPGSPTELFAMPNGNNFFVLSADGQRFLINVETGIPPQLPIEVLVNWTKTIGR